MLLTFVLEQLGSALHTAANAQKALDLAQSYQPALILLDIMLPDFDWMEVCSRLWQNALTYRIPIIAVTALARQEDRERILSAGCNDCVTKPYNVDELEVLLTQYLG